MPLAGVVRSLCADRKPEVGLRTGHHKFQVVGRLASGLRPAPGDAGDAAVLNAAAPTLFNLHLQLEVEVTGFIAAIHDVVVAFRLALQRFAYPDALPAAPDARIRVPPGEALTVEDLLGTRVLVDVVGRGIMKFRHAGQFL